MTRSAETSRKTLETSVSASIELDGVSRVSVSTGVGMFDHLVSAFAFHAGFNLKVTAESPGFLNQHHIVEDTGIVIGQGLRAALGAGGGIARFGDAAVPMDDALVMAAVDVGGRGCFCSDLPLDGRFTEGFECRLALEFWRALCSAAGVAVHLKFIWGADSHHILEAAFKASGVAFRKALQTTSCSEGLPSTKGEARWS